MIIKENVPSKIIETITKTIKDLENKQNRLVDLMIDKL